MQRTILRHCHIINYLWISILWRWMPICTSHVRNQSSLFALGILQGNPPTHGNSDQDARKFAYFAAPITVSLFVKVGSPKISPWFITSLGMSREFRNQTQWKSTRGKIAKLRDIAGRFKVNAFLKCGPKRVRNHDLAISVDNQLCVTLCLTNMARTLLHEWFRRT